MATCGFAGKTVLNRDAVENRNAPSLLLQRSAPQFPPIHESSIAHHASRPVDAVGDPDLPHRPIHLFSSTLTSQLSRFGNLAPSPHSISMRFRRAFPLPHSKRLRRLSIHTC